MTAPNNGFLLRAHSFFFILGAVYVGLVGLLMTPYFQRHAIYMNSLKFPFFANFDNPEKYGLAPNKTVNLKITTSDNEIIGAWFVMSDKYYQALPSIPSEPQQHIATALQRHPTILFFHGNAATRAVKARINHYELFTSRLGVNVLAIDYRGFADSTGTPSEAGIVRDGRAGFDWLVENGAKPEDILIVGHSLGTGVASQVMAQIDAEKVPCRGVVLLAPFSSIRQLLHTYHIFGMLPLMKPMSMIPWMTNLISWALVHKFDALKAVPNINSSVLIAHAEDDWDIPHAHSDVLFEAFIDPLLPTVPLPLSMTPEEWQEITRKQIERSQKRKEIVETSVIPHFGTVSRARVGGRSVTLVKTLFGAHDHIGEQEGVQDLIGRKFGLRAANVD
ncbi:Alpha/Beta hydrolase fold [Amanita muscaria]